MRLVSRLVPAAAVAALAAAALAIPAGTAHAEKRLCWHDAKQVANWTELAGEWAGLGRWDKFQESMDWAYEAAGGYC